MRGMIRAAAGLVVGGVAVFAGTQATQDNTVRDDTGAIVESGGLGAFAMQVGDCFNDPGADATQVQSVEGVPCGEPHDNEVFAEFDVEHASFPGEQEVFEEGWERCLTYFDAYVGTPYEDSILDIGAFSPSVGSWAEGDREITCYVYHLQGQKLTVTARGSGL